MTQDLRHRLEDAALEAFEGDRLNEVIALIWAQPDDQSVHNLGVALGLIGTSEDDRDDF